MRPQRSVFIKYNPDGTIKERYRVLREGEFNPGRSYKEIVKKEDKDRLVGDITDVLYKEVEDEVVSKPVITIKVHKELIDADGKDETKVELIGVPDDMEEVEVKVGRQTQKIDPREPFYVNMSVPQTLTISVLDRTVKAQPANVRARKKVRQINGDAR